MPRTWLYFWGLIQTSCLMTHQAFIDLPAGSPGFLTLVRLALGLWELLALYLRRAFDRSSWYLFGTAEQSFSYINKQIRKAQLPRYLLCHSFFHAFLHEWDMLKSTYEEQSGHDECDRTTVEWVLLLRSQDWFCDKWLNFWLGNISYQNFFLQEAHPKYYFS